MDAIDKIGIRNPPSAGKFRLAPGYDVIGIEIDFAVNKVRWNAKHP
jgi:hypothetical protein